MRREVTATPKFLPNAQTLQGRAASRGQRFADLPGWFGAAFQQSDFGPAPAKGEGHDGPGRSAAHHDHVNAIRHPNLRSPSRICGA